MSECECDKRRAETNATTACFAGTVVCCISQRATLVSGKAKDPWTVRLGNAKAAEFTLALPKKTGSLQIQWSMDEDVRGADDTMTLQVDSSKTPLVLRASATQDGSRNGLSSMAVLASDSILRITAASSSTAHDHHMYITRVEFVPGLESLAIILWTNLTTDRPTPTN